MFRTWMLRTRTFCLRCFGPACFNGWMFRTELFLFLNNFFFKYLFTYYLILFRDFCFQAPVSKQGYNNDKDMKLD